MSKASEWAKRCAQARAASPDSFVHQGNNPRHFTASVSGIDGYLELEDKRLPPDVALSFAAWIIDTFGELEKK